MLFGHAAPIADLCICYPLLTSSDWNMNHERNVGVRSSSEDRAALLSVCSDGVLCVWSKGSGHCRRRRKLPPWVGSPSKIQMLPLNGRYVCVASCLTDNLHASDQDFMDSVEGNEVLGDQESSSRRAAKCAIVIVDSYTLTIVHTVFHGHLSIGPLKYMMLVQSVDDERKHSVLLADSHGKIQLIPLSKDSLADKEGGTKQHGDSPLTHTSAINKGSYEGGLVVSVVACRLMIALVYKTQCVFVLVPNCTVVGSISFENEAHGRRTDCGLTNVVGGTFITSQSEEMQNADFVVWDDRGFAIMYKISVVDNMFSSEVICEIPADSFPIHMKLSLHFVQLCQFLLRVESICYCNEEPFLCRPRISIWSLHQRIDDHEKFGKGCQLLGEGDFLDDWLIGCRQTSKTQEHTSIKESATTEAAVTSIDGIPEQEDTSAIPKDDLKCSYIQKENVVSSTMVISENVHYPYAVVYGYQSGEIELIRFNMFNILTQKAESAGVTLCHDVDCQESEQRLLGHTGPVLCLAAHQMASTSNNQAYTKVLLSGSRDCTFRIWDLETCNPIMVMHHHVAPVCHIVLPPLQSDLPWNNCILTVGADSCVSLLSLETLRVERMFPGHPGYPSQVVWDGLRGYLACLSQNLSISSNVKDTLYIWDIKGGSRERVLRGTAAHSMLSNFSKGMGTSNISGCASNYNTSTSSLVLPSTEAGGSLPSKLKSSISSNEVNLLEHSISSVNFSEDRFVNLSSGRNDDRVPIRCFCPNSGIAILSFDLSSLLSAEVCGVDGGKQWHGPACDEPCVSSPDTGTVSSDYPEKSELCYTMEGHKSVNSCKLSLLQFSLSLLHLWGVDIELDNLLKLEMKVRRYEKLTVAPGLEGDRGSITLTFPAFSSTLQLWKSSSEFCALRSLIMVSLAQSMVSLSHSCSMASSALSAFYTRNFVEKVQDLKPPSLQLLVSFWQDEDEHVRMAARTLFHCAASRAIPPPLYCLRMNDITQMVKSVDTHGDPQRGEAEIVEWLNSYELQDWVSCVGGTSQDAMASHIIVAAALAIWYPSLVKPTLAMLVVHHLIKLVMAMNEKYSSAAAELLAEGMDNTWKACIGAEIQRLIGDIFFQIECVSGASANFTSVAAAVPPKLRETLVGILLPSLALADIPGFLSVIEGLIWSTASDSPVHLVSLKTLIRLMRGSPRNLAQYLHKVVNFILQTIDPANSVMRKTCFQSSMATLREVVRVYPMVALNDTSTQLAVGDAIAEVNHASIHVYDMQSVAKIKVLDANGPPGLPTLLAGASETVIVAISALSFSPDGEGLIAFSEHGLLLRWWSLGTAWWGKLSRSFVPIQCTKLIFVPPWEGFSPSSSRASVIANITGNFRPANSQEHTQSSNVDSLILLLYNLDLSYRLEWIEDRRVRLLRHGQDIETFLI